MDNRPSSDNREPAPVKRPTPLGQNSRAPLVDASLPVSPDGKNKAAADAEHERDFSSPVIVRLVAALASILLILALVGYMGYITGRSAIALSNALAEPTVIITTAVPSATVTVGATPTVTPTSSAVRDPGVPTQPRPTATATSVPATATATSVPATPTIITPQPTSTDMPTPVTTPTVP